MLRDSQLTAENLKELTDLKDIQFMHVPSFYDHFV